MKDIYTFLKLNDKSEQKYFLSTNLWKIHFYQWKLKWYNKISICILSLLNLTLYINHLLNVKFYDYQLDSEY